MITLFLVPATAKSHHLPKWTPSSVSVPVPLFTILYWPYRFFQFDCSRHCSILVSIALSLTKEMPMKRLVFAILLAAAVLLPATALAQDTPKPSESSTPHKARTVAALVSADGSSFLDTHQGQWQAANPASLSGYQNQRVKVKFQLLPGQNRAQILSVKPLPVYTRTSANPSDSAFRR
jgi:hypothetical protein